MYIRGKYLYGNKDVEEVMDIRRKVFCEEQEFDESVTFDEYDSLAIHALVYNEEDVPVASGRIIINNDEFLIGRIGVLKEERGKKIGDFLVRMLVDKVFSLGGDCVVVHSQLHAIKFYKKIGFVLVGEVFEENGVPHQRLEIKNGQLCKECNNPSCK